MNSVVGLPLPSDNVTSSVEIPELSLFRLYTLRAAYFVMAAGLGVFIWPAVIHHTSEFAVAQGVQFALLAGLGATAALGLRYPVQMLPVLLFEFVWKAIYLIAFALPLWYAHRINQAAAEDIQSVVMVVIFIPLVPWRYVFARYVLKRGTMSTINAEVVFPKRRTV